MKMIMEHRWNDDDREKPKYADKNVCQNHIVHHIAWAGAGSNPGLRRGFTDRNKFALYIKHSFSSRLTENRVHTCWKYREANAV
jgi:hypothetical protein